MVKRKLESAKDGSLTMIRQHGLVCRSSGWYSVSIWTQKLKLQKSHSLLDIEKILVTFYLYMTQLLLIKLI
ncbi:hypothetical protein L3X38_019291 [Prunus dulcis]|uniref:Uncharacterized protein n=1 Tax=Prunus dulcis TaxID=3755 RepID=A0AAD4WCV8_PRUDU|nr:hypothetical protein L3X38_019291 [Prunus dulcis]